MICRTVPWAPDDRVTMMVTAVLSSTGAGGGSGMVSSQDGANEAEVLSMKPKPGDVPGRKGLLLLPSLAPSSTTTSHTR